MTNVITDDTNIQNEKHVAFSLKKTMQVPVKKQEVIVLQVCSQLDTNDYKGVDFLIEALESLYEGYRGVVFKERLIKENCLHNGYCLGDSKVVIGYKKNFVT